MGQIFSISWNSNTNFLCFFLLMLKYIDRNIAGAIDYINPHMPLANKYISSKQAYGARSGVYTPSPSRGRNGANALVLRSVPYKRYGTRALGSNREKKFHDVSDLANTTAIAGTIGVDLLIVPQGTTEKNRIGRKMWIKQINVRYTMSLSKQEGESGGGSSMQQRFMLIHDKQCNGALPAVLDILETAVPLSYRNLANAARFTILKDKLVTFNTGAGAGNGTANDFSQTLRIYKFSKKCNIPITFDGTDGGIDEKKSGNIFILQIANSTGGTWTAHCRFRFTD